MDQVHAFRLEHITKAQGMYVVYAPDRLTHGSNGYTTEAGGDAIGCQRDIIAACHRADAVMRRAVQPLVVPQYFLLSVLYFL